MRTILTAENLKKDYRVGKVDVHALRGVSLEVLEHQINRQPMNLKRRQACRKLDFFHNMGSAQKSNLHFGDPGPRLASLAFRRLLG